MSVIFKVKKSLHPTTDHWKCWSINRLAVKSPRRTTISQISIIWNISLSKCFFFLSWWSLSLFWCFISLSWWFSLYPNHVSLHSVLMVSFYFDVFSQKYTESGWFFSIPKISLYPNGLFLNSMLLIYLSALMVSLYPLFDLFSM